MSEGSSPQVPRLRGTDEGMLNQLERSRSRGRWKRRWRWALLGEHAEPHPPMVGLYEPPAADTDPIGVCCSGGGIRSASFNLGALQALQEHGVLQRSKYLTAVSGGSYIAAAFSMVAKTWPPGTKPDKRDDSDPDLVTDAAPPFKPGSPEEQYLRTHLSYLAPNASAKVYLGLRMLAGLCVNVIVVGMPALIVGLLVGWLGRTHYGHLQLGAPGCSADACHYRAVIPASISLIVLGLVALALFLAVVGVLWRPRRDRVRAFLETWQVRCLVIGAVAAVILILVPWLAAQALNISGVSVDKAALGSTLTAVGSLAALFGAALGHVRGVLRDEKKAIAGAKKKLGKYGKKVREILVALAVTLAGPLLLISIGVLGVLLAIQTSPAGARDTYDTLAGHVTPAYVAWLGGSLALLVVTYVLLDLTTVSLHPFYRRRLATAFALKRVRVNGRPEARQRDFDNLVPLSKSGIEPDKHWPMLVVCAAANVSDPGATPPGRPVGSFTFSPSAIGGPLTGAARTKWYETDLGRNRRRDLTLPAAVAMSGAAISPSMGKLTYRPLTFLLALANIRLGVWVPNPTYINDARAKGAIGKSRDSSLSPARSLPWHKQAAQRVSLRHRPRPVYLWKEILGRNRLEDKFLYVSDGGHYENLGLVELLRRGCRTIYCFDAGGGSSEQALGDAVALARSELNVDIEMLPETLDLAEDPDSHRSKQVCARGTIHYPPGPDGAAVEGTLFYARSVVCADAAWELLTYQAVDSLFPHHSTLDQFFDDQKFEAYRLLGAFVAKRAMKMEPLHSVQAPEPEPPAEARPGRRKPKHRPPDDSGRAILAYVSQHDGSSVDELMNDLPLDDVYRELGPLVRSGALIRTGAGRDAVLKLGPRR
jgi:hypothetical protein